MLPEFLPWQKIGMRLEKSQSSPSPQMQSHAQERGFRWGKDSLEAISCPNATEASRTGGPVKPFKVANQSLALWVEPWELRFEGNGWVPTAVRPQNRPLCQQ